MITVSTAGKEYKETIGQAYVITANGITALRQAEGRSRHKRIAKMYVGKCFQPRAEIGNICVLAVLLS